MEESCGTWKWYAESESLSTVCINYGDQIKRQEFLGRTNRPLTFDVKTNRREN
jgi:hypothetical protein